MSTPKTEAMRAVTRSYPLPKSVCVCGHSGDGPLSAHRPRLFAEGHGACHISNCDCLQFTWKGWTEEFQAALDAA